MFWLLFLVCAGAIFFGAWLLHKYLLTQDKRRKEGLERLLGVPQKYEFNAAMITDRTAAYEEQKELFEDQFADENKIPDHVELPANWCTKLPGQKKDILKVLLMQRAMGWVVVYRELEKDLKSNYPLYKKGIIPPDYWFSIKDAEEVLEKQFDSIKKEAQTIEPAQDGTTIFREAVMMVDKYGLSLEQELDEDGMPAAPQQPAAPSGKGAGKGGAGPAQAKAPGGGPAPDAKGAGKQGGGAPAGPRPPARIEKFYTDNATYAITQEEEDAELMVFVPNNVYKKDIKVDLKQDAIAVLVMGTPIFVQELSPIALIKTDTVTWTLAKKGDFEPGDTVELHGLTMKKLNGGNGVCLKPDKDTAKDRVRVELSRPDKGRILAIKMENLKNTAKDAKKAAVIVSLEKAKKGAVWPMPPWKN